ncbi:DUF4998 domain-containing protein [Parapedobacter sp. 10938]|uniref:DUF4998 domain-containing protein n=1 Tax=Parapedobacter flavus TaxID=3110225 RepID=UPI002DBF93A9|nr:DUF4998 domain-containing protein [Parapedobacter sp. 10938]MEC3881655.1 DUF4998 domain-containing protein [Parapedobacter sp. 10938]
MKKYINWYVVALMASVALFACRKSDDYKKYMAGGEIVYPAKADSINVHPGDSRIMLSWIRTDPRVTHYQVYWNLGTDSIRVEVPMNGSEDGVDTVEAWIEGLEEVEYEFDVVSFDEDGNQSVKSSVAGRVYGDNYAGTLLNRGIQSIQVSPLESTAQISWFAADSTDIAVEVTYTDVENNSRKVILPNTGKPDTVTRYKPGTDFSYRTLFLPDSLAVDTFYASSVEIAAPPVTYPDLDNAKFRAYTLPGDAPSAYGWELPYAWDGTAAEGRGFHTPELGYPVQFSIDLGTLAVLHQMKLWQREVDNAYFNEGNPKKFEIWGSQDPSSDGSDNGWVKLGEFQSVKPSGLPLGELSDEDIAVASTGETFYFDDPTTAVRYIRFRILEVWKPDRPSAHVMELSFAGEVINE